MRKQDISVSWKIYFVVCIIIISICSIVQKNNLFMLISSVCGVIYVLLNAKGIKYSFLFGIINAFTYGIILILQKMYGSACYNLLYVLPMLIYGYFKVSQEKEFSIHRLDNHIRIYMLGVFITLVIGISVILKIFGGSLVVLDSISSIGGFLAIFLLSNRYIEQWPVFILVNLAGVVTWAIFTAQNILNLPMLLTWSIYTVNSIYGQITWSKK
ncbi:MAG: nicotinamide riboside transporter PnuC [Clostridia bacterium]|nr:nicotinamide riboside transporter PnuC [Clostridia bacterium]